jgi:serine/threonine protein kinase
MASDSPPRCETLGNYDLLEVIGQGSMGTVYRARHWQTKEIVAMKVMAAHIASNPVLLKRFEQEFRITSKLEHPNVIRVMEYCGTGPNPFLVMEMVDGESLGEKLEREGKLPEEEALRIIVQVSHGLHRAHRQGLIHRDIKPDNIMMTRDGKAKVTDLGLAKDIVDGVGELTQTGRGLGTPNFMAPEQFRNAKHVDIRSDIYSLAATLYQMVTGEVPFGEGDPVQLMMRKVKNELPSARSLNPALSERTDVTIKRAMSARPDSRPATCREFVEDLLGQSTRPGSRSDLSGGQAESWFLVYKDREGSVRTAQGDPEVLRNGLKQGKFGSPFKARVSRVAAGPFEGLQLYPEFRDLVAGEPTDAAPLSERTVMNLTRLRDLKNKPAPPPEANGAAPPPAPASKDEGSGKGLALRPLNVGPVASAAPKASAESLSALLRRKPLPNGSPAEGSGKKPKVEAKVEAPAKVETRAPVKAAPAKTMPAKAARAKVAPAKAAPDEAAPAEKLPDWLKNALMIVVTALVTLLIAYAFKLLH